ncbi:MAG: MBL fold metallo-hydrolase [Tissierellales bacterium]|jgi:glyoxylase-like metal-dependent hydrolase (beta-lactamase superfamily II)|nr:MBL fold metallo-hydrolase [Tissierellales bacterium]
MKIQKIKGKTCIILKKGVTTLLYKLKENYYVLIDPGHLTDKNYKEYIDFLKDNNIFPKYIICTHGHVDHANAVLYIKKEFKSKVIMPEYEAYFFDNPKFYIEKVVRAKNINYESIYPNSDLKVDYIIREENEIELEGEIFKVVRLPGHSFNHCGFATPDDVLYLGDTILSEDIIKKTKIPYIYDIETDIKSKRKILNLEYKHYIVSHNGEIKNIEKTIKKNIEFINKFILKIMNYLKNPMTYEDITQKINLELGIGKSLLKYVIAERSIKSFVYYLEKTNHIKSFIEDNKIYYKENKDFKNIKIRG